MAAPRRKRSLAGVTPASYERAAAPRAATLIYESLRDDIVWLRRKPMELLNEKELELQFGVSRTPIREAILRLADDGLVDVFPQSGTFVSRIPRRGIYEAILVRKALEDTTIRLAAEKVTPVGIAGLERNLDDMAAAMRAGNRPAFHDIDNGFHRQISDIAGFPGIWAIIQQVKVHSDRFRLLTLPQEGRLTRVLDEHAAIIDGLRRGDAAAGAAAMATHLGKLLGEIASLRSLDPAFFVDDMAPTDPPPKPQDPTE